MNRKTYLRMKFFTLFLICVIGFGFAVKAINTSVEQVQEQQEQRERIEEQTLQPLKSAGVSNAIRGAMTKKVEPATEVTRETEKPESLVYSRDWDAEDGYLLAKIAMAEAEGEDTEGKALVICVVLNRVWSDGFEGTIEDVIFEKNQFSTVFEGGRWWTTEPNEDCYRALEMVTMGWDESRGALYFESGDGDGWHSRNLEFLFKHGRHRFYK